MSTQNLGTRVTKQSEPRMIRDKLLKVRLNARENYLLKQIDEKLGYANVSTTIRWLIENYNNIDRARQLVEAAQKQIKSHREFITLAELNESPFGYGEDGGGGF